MIFGVPGPAWHLDYAALIVIIDGLCPVFLLFRVRSRGRTCEAMAELFGVLVSPGTVAGMADRVAATLGACVEAVCQALAAAGVAHFDETGFLVAGTLAWVHSASSGKYALLTVHYRRGREAMDAAGVLPAFWVPQTP